MTFSMNGLGVVVVWLETPKKRLGEICAFNARTESRGAYKFDPEIPGGTSGVHLSLGTKTASSWPDIKLPACGRPKERAARRMKWSATNGLE